MKKSTLMMALLAGVFFTMPAVAESESKPSFANKKSGQVAFERSEKDVVDTTSAAAEAQDPASIEPAAGASDDVSDAKKENSLADDLKLPRKN